MLRFTNIIYLAVAAGIIWLFFIDPGSPEGKESGKIRFLSMAWQTQAVETNRRIVAEWNAENPDLQVEYLQGSWDFAHDYLITGFETGDVPEVFHYSTPGLVDFSLQGNLMDLSPYISETMKDDIIDITWELVTRSNGEVTGIPFLIEPVLSIYNKRLFEKAGVVAPTFENPWTWEDFRNAAKKLTVDSDNDGRIDQWGAAIGLRKTSEKMVTQAPSFGGSFIYEENGKPVFRVTEAEKRLMGTFREMLLEDQVLTPFSAGATTMDLLPGFFQEKHAIILQVGIYLRQQMVENAPEGFRWGVFPPLLDQSQLNGTVAQTLSIPGNCSRPEAAMAFIEYFLNTRNMAELALGDWLAPTRKSCFELPEFQKTEGDWKAAIQSVDYSVPISFKEVPGYWEWEARAGNPVFDELFANRISLEEACRRLENESNQVLRRYQIKKVKW